MQEALLQSDRLSDISELDRQDLARSYSLAYTQRMGKIFNWCHQVMWDYLEAIGDRDAQRELFMHSSFLWRLSGDSDNELRYARLLSQAERWDSSVKVGPVAALLRYCLARVKALAGV